MTLENEMGNWKVEILDGSHWLSDYLIIKRLSGIRKLKYLICIRERNIEKLNVSLRYETYTPRISHPCLNSSSQTEIKFIHCLYLIENGWSKTPPHDPHHNGKSEKKKVLRNTLHFSFFSPCFLGGAWRVSKTRQIASPCKQENYSQIPEKPQDWSSSVNYKSNREVLKI